MINVITIGNQHTFHGITKASVDALVKAGYKCKTLYYPNNFNQNQIEYSDVNFIIHGHKVKPNKNCCNILFQTEQFAGIKIDYGLWSRVLVGFPEHVVHEKDFYFPVGYSKHFDSDLSHKEDREFYFFGAMTERRQEICKKYSIKFNNLNGRAVYGKNRDNLIVSSKFNVSFHPWSTDYLYPSFRGLLVMCKGKIYLQESCVGGYGIYKDYVVDFTTKNFTDVVNEWADKKKRNEFALQVRKELKEKYRFEDLFIPLIKDIL